MATIKSYSDLQQSKKLAEILSLDTADQCFLNDGTAIKAEINSYAVAMKLWKEYYIEIIPCWSLAALLGVLSNYQLQTQDDGIGILCSCNGKFNIVTADNPVDTCVEIIIRLNKLNLL